ncbi:MAG TPA: ABC transporter substrate-binding protein [Stellaceae bacterium]|nr:ABC transporter substrate-binding protein [Stellaceae bacterium]
MSKRYLFRRRRTAELFWPGLRVAGAAAMLAALAVTAAAEPQPKRGGILDFAVDAEPGNYDCDANVSFAFMHPVAPHYSTLLKFDGADYPQVKGDLAESWSVSADRRTYTFRLRPNVLFHDGSHMTSADVKVSYERIIHPPEGVISARQVYYSAIDRIDTPDALTVVFHLRWPEAAMLANFASPWNCIYSAAKLKEDPLYPKTHILGTGPFTFVEHVKGDHWTGKRFDRYFRPGHPYLDGYVAHFVAGAKVVQGLEQGSLKAEFRSVTPAERDALVAAMGDKIYIGETPWLIDLMIVFNAHQPPFDDPRVRRALSLAIDRWHAAERLQSTTFLKFVGGVMRPGFAMATPESELATIPGFGHDIEAARAEAKRLLAEAGQSHLAFTLTNRDIAMPYGPAADYLIQSWKEIGVTVNQEKLDTKHWESALERHAFIAAIDFAGDYFDDPTLQLAKYVSSDLSPSNFSGSTDRFLDSLYVGQAVTTDPRERTRIVREFERRALTDAYAVPFLWWNRIVAASAAMKGWHLTPSHYLEQDLADVWLDTGIPPTRADLQ